MIIKCSEPKTELLDGGARLSCKLESEHLPPELYARVRGPVPLDTWQANWAAVALLYPAMALGADLHIKAPVSGRLLHALKSDVQALLVSYEPSLRRVEIVADVEQDVLLPPTGVATGFSAGVDSLATIALYEACPLPFRLSHLVVFNDGIFEGLFEPYRARCESYAAANGFGHFSVETNFGEVFNASPSDVGSFIRTHSLRNASTALLLEHAIGTYLYSSGIPYSEIRGGPASDMAHIDPILLPLLSSDRLRFVSAGAGMSRTEKTELISERQDAKKNA